MSDEISDREYIATLNRDLMVQRARSEGAEAEADRLRAENERLRQVLDNALLGYRRLGCDSWPRWVRPALDLLDAPASDETVAREENA